MDARHSRSSLRLASSATGTIDVLCRVVENSIELAEHHRIRRTVFVEEQKLFNEHDRDEIDEDPAVLHVLGFENGIAGGTVRLYPTPTPAEPFLWKGDRLAVLVDYRHSGLGGPLVRRAVELAQAAGGTRMEAWVQLPHVRFFEYLGWVKVGGPAPYVGELHQQMSILLA